MKQEQLNTMTEEARHVWLDTILSEMCFNLDITDQDNGESILEKLRQAISPLVLSQEHWITYGAYCLRSSIETAMNKKKESRIQ